MASDDGVALQQRLRHVPNSGDVLDRSGVDLPSLMQSPPGPHLDPTLSRGDVAVTPAQNATYARHWSEVVLGATSAIMFLLVLSICYALYVLVAPYGQSIMYGVLLSIVMHPRSRLRSALYMGTAVDRMTRMQRHWAVRGRLMGLIGSWLSLRHFVSFVVMQGTFFLGLNKLRVHARSRLLGDGGTGGYAAVAAAAPPPTRAMSGAQRKQGGSGAGAGTRAPAATTAAKAAASAVAAPASPTAQHPLEHRRLVATPRGRRVLRYLTAFIAIGVAHLLIGVAYFVLLHLALAAVFAVTVPFMSAGSFVASMGRLWRVAVIAFFLAGLALNATADVLSIGAAVRRTTSAVVGSSGGGGAEQEAQPSPRSSSTSMRAAALNSSSSGTVGSAPLSTDVVMAALGVAGPQHSRLDVLLVDKLQDVVVQELADMFSDGNVTLMLETLMQVLPPPLLAIVTRDAVGAASSTASSGASFEATRFSWRTAWASARSLRSASAARSLIYASLSGSAGRAGSNANGSADVELSTGGGGGHGASNSAAAKVDIDWLTVSRLIASRVLPYVEFALRLCMRVGANLLGLFDSLYAVMLFVFFYRYLTQLEHTVLYYGVAKALRVMQPELGGYHARNIEQDITVSFITLLQSFWHLTWFHFCVTFCVFKMWGFPTPFLQGLVSVVLALFPLVPKWLSPCSIALVYMLVQLASLLTSEVPGALHGGTAAAPLLELPAEGHAWVEVRVWGKPYPLHYTRALSLALAVLLECGDEWLLCVSRGLRGGFITDAAGKGREQLQPFVVGTSLVLGFVAYGTRGIVFGPLTVIVARVLFDNWDVVVASRDLTSSFAARPSPSSPPRYFLDEADEEDANPAVESPEVSGC